MANSLVVMLDDIDLSKPVANRLDYLFWLKGKYPQFKCSLFVIPMRSTWEWIHELNKISWIEICMHGWNHNIEESITLEMIKEWQNHGLPSIYKGPEWKVSTEEITSPCTIRVSNLIIVIDALVSAVTVIAVSGLESLPNFS